jgi:isoleucyl-tRNA synthetase
VFAAARDGAWESADDGSVLIAGHRLTTDEYELGLVSPEGVVAAALRSNDAVVSLDTERTPELEAEGLARDLVREIQNARKADELVVTDRIDVWVDVAADDLVAAIETHRAYIAEQVLAESITLGAGDDALRVHDAHVAGEPLRFTLRVH